jgi:DNA-binding MarR family transcriptional regulator
MGYADQETAGAAAHAMNETRDMAATPKVKAAKPGYILDEQVGFILRQVSQRHAVIFSEHMGADVTPTQWAALSKLAEVGPTSQNLLGRMTAMDVATIKGVVDRLIKRGMIKTHADKTDARRHLVSLTKQGEDFVAQCVTLADAITKQTLSPLKASEQTMFLELLKRLL